MVYKITIEDDGSVEYMNESQLIEFSKNLQTANKEDSTLPSFLKRNNLAKDIESCLLIIKWAGHDCLVFNSVDDYYIDLAKTAHGFAVRDNTVRELISIGMELDDLKVNK
jgi:hypothetical protein